MKKSAIIVALAVGGLLVLLGLSPQGSVDSDIRQLRQDSYMATVNGYAEKAASDAGQDFEVDRSSEGVRGWRGGAGSSVAGTNVGSIGREVWGDKQMEDRYATLAHISREKAKKLEAHEARPKQIIHGHDGNTVFSLESTKDLTEDLASISIGDTVTWTGTRLSADESSESWTITSIRKVN